MIELYRPKYDDLWFRERFLSDPETMSYNNAWGGTVPFSESEWADWYDYWLVHHEGKRFYRYLRDSETGRILGEVAYHFDEGRKFWLADVIVASEFRGRGYGTQGLRLLCRAAVWHGIGTLRDDIAIDNPAIRMFFNYGFVEEYRTDEIIMLRKDLQTDHRKILIVGCPGSGKSTFARKLRDRTGLPLHYLDRIFHNADRTSVSRKAFDEKLSEILKTDEWIIDGNYQRTLPQRFASCSTVFFFDLPVEQCLKGAASRIGQEREDMPWTEDAFDPEFRQYILDFPKDQIPRLYELVEQYKDSKEIMIFHSREESVEFLEII